MGTAGMGGVAVVTSACWGSVPGQIRAGWWACMCTSELSGAGQDGAAVGSGATCCSVEGAGMLHERGVHKGD